MRKENINNPRFPHTIKVIRNTKTEDNFGNGETISRILYEGVGRSFTDTTTDGDSKVVTNMRKVSIPVRFDKWENDDFPLNGDTIEARIGKVVERGMVRDCEADNDRTIVYLEVKRT